MSSTARFWLRAAVTFALTELSFRLVERPVRDGSAMRWIRASGGPTTICGRGPGAGSRSGRSRRCCVGVVGSRVATADPVDLTTGGAEEEFVVPVGGALEELAPRPPPARARHPVRERSWAPSHPTFLVASRSSATRRPPSSSERRRASDRRSTSMTGPRWLRAVRRGLHPHHRELPPGLRQLRGLAGRVAEAAADGQAQITLVVLGAWDVFDLDRDDGLLRFATPEYDVAYVTTQLQRRRWSARAARSRCWRCPATNPSTVAVSSRSLSVVTRPARAI